MYKKSGLPGLQQHKIVRITNGSIRAASSPTRILPSSSPAAVVIQTFARVVLLRKKGFCLDQIRISTGFSHRLIGEYLKLLAAHSKSRDLQRILQSPEERGR